MAIKDKVPLVPSIDPQGTTGFFSDGGAYSRNVMAETFPDGTFYTTQRPSIEVVIENETFSGGGTGRGIFYWEEESTVVAVVDDTVYDSGGSSLGTISSGTNPVAINTLGDYLVILDEQNNEGWYLDSALTLSSISDPDFPSTLAGGEAVLNGSMYVMDVDGVIYNSAYQDPTSWAPLDFLEAERDPDGGVYITKYFDHVVAFGVRTIEFFYDSANPVGSPLSRREDIFYRVGALSTTGIYNGGEVIYFVQADVSGATKIAKLENFRLETISPPQLSRYIESRVRTQDVDLILSGSHVFGHLFVYVTFVVREGNSLILQGTLVYDASTSMYTEFYTGFGDIEYFPVISWTARQIDSAEFSLGMMTTGDVFRYSGNLDPVDRVNTSPYVVSGYWTTGYVEEGTSNTGEYIIDLAIRTDEWSGRQGELADMHNKFVHKVEVTSAPIREYIDDGVPMYVNWTDDEYQTYSTQRAVSLKGKRRLTRCGMTTNRAYQLTYQGSNRIRVGELQLYFGVASYA